MLDLDNTSEKKALEFAYNEYDYWKLEGYLLMKSSKRNYSVIYNKRMSWKKVLRILNSIALRNLENRKLITWVLLQGLKGAITIRVSKKGTYKPKPKIIFKFGKTDKIIKEYLLAYNMY